MQVISEFSEEKEEEGLIYYKKSESEFIAKTGNHI